MAKINIPSISTVQKRRIALIFMFLIVALGVISLIFTEKEQMILRTAVVTEDTPLYMDPGLSQEYSVQLNKGDLINVIYRHKDNVFYILDSGAVMPFKEGYLPGEKFSYSFTTANQGILMSNSVYSKKNAQKPAGYVVEKGRTPCIIHGFEDDWANISLPGGIDGLWVEKSNIKYDLNYDLLKEENFGHYNIVKDYMETEYISTYNNYYDHNYIRYLTAYDEEYDEQTGVLTAEFIMNGMSKNKYRDPDTVKYIKDAKESAQSETDRLYYETLYREYNMYRTCNFILKLTAITDGETLAEVKLYSDMGVGAEADWKELKKGLRDFIID